MGIVFLTGPQRQGTGGTLTLVLRKDRDRGATGLAMAGASIKEIQEAAGHKTIMMAARYKRLSDSRFDSSKVLRSIITPKVVLQLMH